VEPFTDPVETPRPGALKCVWIPGADGRLECIWVPDWERDLREAAAAESAPAGSAAA
jgi:hypothetical protein